MKKTLLILAASVAVSGAVTVRVGDFTRGVTLNDGTALPSGSGIIAAGYLLNDLVFASNQTFTLDEQASLISSFVQWGDSGVAGQGASDVAGFFQFNADDGRVGPGDEALGRNIVVAVGNGLTLASSTELALFVSSETFTDDSNTPTPANPAVPVAESGLLGFDAGNTALDLPTLTLAQVAVIPEPSVTLLGGLALFGGLVRRRR